ncbi:TlpA family protein disulfide reductase [bacterium]|nr:TlpA family protein disulfide reductase [bacterium]MBU4134381.1 TlpA family protein disulfide reductase [bacterium]
MKMILLAAVFFLSFSACRVSENGAGEASSLSGKKAQRRTAADFTVPSINGASVNLASLRGKVIIIDFWATWCGPCVYEIPGFINLKNKYAKDGFEIIGLSVDRDKAAVMDFVRQKGINYPVAFADGDLQDQYGGIKGIPTTFFIDRSGRIADKIVGAHEEIFFENKIKELLNEEADNG